LMNYGQERAKNKKNNQLYLMTVTTRVPSKYRMIDLETGVTYKWDPNGDACKQWVPCEPVKPVQEKQVAPLMIMEYKVGEIRLYQTGRIVAQRFETAESQDFKTQEEAQRWLKV